MTHIRKILLFITSFILLCVVSLMIPKETMPSEDERIILEHTYQTYIAPPCFQEADATNFLEDADLEKAYELNYDVNDTCTEEFFQSEKDSLFVNILKRIGLMKTKWDK